MADHAETTERVSVTVVETRRLHAETLALLLGLDHRFETVRASTFDVDPDKIRSHTALVAIDDPRGLELAGRLDQSGVAVRVIGLHSGAGPELATSAFNKGVRALARRDGGLGPITDAVFGSLSASALGSATETTMTALSGRESEVIEGIANGKKIAEITRHLHLTVGEATAARRRAYGKLGARTQTEAVTEARRRGLLSATSRRNR